MTKKTNISVIEDTKSDLRVLALSKCTREQSDEYKINGYVMNGNRNAFYYYVIDRYEGSVTNATIINTYVDLMYGQGIKDTSGNFEGFLKLNSMLSKDDLRKIIFDFVLFGEARMQIITSKNGESAKIYHLATECTAPEEEIDGEISAYYYSPDFRKINDDLTERLPILSNKITKGIFCYPITTYRAGGKYFSVPDYNAGLQYAELEEEISNYYISHIKNGLSFGYIINIPNGNTYSDEEKDELERKIKAKLTSSSNAGRFVLSFNGSEEQITVTTIDVADAHKQWEFLTGEAKQQLITAHRVTSPMLFGIKDNTGLGNNADELDVAEAQMLKRVIKPKQNRITDALEYVMRCFGIDLNLEFIPLSATNNSNNLTLNSHTELDNFISKGEYINSLEYELINAGEVDYENNDIEVEEITKISLSTNTGTARPSSKSEQDSKDIIIRYRYVGNPTPEREFCRKMMSANKLYRKEDIIALDNKVVNEGFGMHPNPNAPYSIWLYKGGGKLTNSYKNGTCRHKWQREIYLRNGASESVKQALNNAIISTSEARRRGYKVPVNDSRVSIAPHDMNI